MTFWLWQGAEVQGVANQISVPPLATYQATAPEHNSLCYHDFDSQEKTYINL